LHLVKAIPSLGEFAQGTAAEIFNPYVALQAWAGTPGLLVFKEEFPTACARSPMRAE
jgi:hypothetical protein